jgi:hypothetical protein
MTPTPKSDAEIGAKVGIWSDRAEVTHTPSGASPAQPELCVAYGRLKAYLAAEHGSDPNNRDAYRSGKAEWVSAVTRRAMADGRPL